MGEVFKFKDHSYDFRNNNSLQKWLYQMLSIRQWNSFESRSKTLGYPSWKYSENSESLLEFKNKTELWTPANKFLVQTV